MKPIEQYIESEEKYKKLLGVSPDALQSPVAIKEWKLCCFEEKMKLQNIARRLTHEEKKELGMFNRDSFPEISR